MPHDNRMPDKQFADRTAIAELQQIIDTKKVPNALLFTGNPGVGRKQAAFMFAKAVNCTSDTRVPCNLCRSCKKIDAGMHPDMVHVHLPDKKKAITISQIREMEASILARPNEARFRMVLISNAGHMNAQAQNALLKALEEPARGTFFILLARDTAKLLPTIRSRVRHLHFKPLTGTALADHLCASFSADPQSARIAAATAGADLNLALTLLNMADGPGLSNDNTFRNADAYGRDWQAGRVWIIRQLCDLISGPAAARVQNALSFSRQMSLDPDHIVPGLAVMRTFFRDLCVCRHVPEKTINLDFSAVFQDIVRQVTEEHCLRWMTAFHETEQRLASNSSVRMTLDRFFLRMIQI